MVTQNPARTSRPPTTPPVPNRRRSLRSRWSGMDDGHWRLTVACAIATVVSSWALAPLLDGGWWLVPSATVVAVVAGAGGLARSLLVPAPAQPLVSAAALLIALTALFARGDAVLNVLPGPGAIGRLQQLALQGRAFIESSVPPAGEDAGLLLLVAGGIGLTALVVDTLACSLDLPGATLVPLSGLFLVPWIIGHGSAPAWTFLTIVLAWVVILATAQGDWARRWAPTARAGRLAATMVMTGAVAVGALIVGAVAANRVPVVTLGSGFDIGNGTGTLQIDELVTLRRSLVENDDREVMAFSADTTQVDYLRLAVLEWFDGERWSRAPRTQLEGAPPGWAAGGGPDGDLVRYRLRIGPLGGATLPSPSGTVGADAPWPVAWDQRSTLPSRSDGRGVKGQRIELTVWPMPWNADTLRTASVQEAADYGVFQSDMMDPTPLVGPELATLAAQITQGKTTPYDQAVALQNFFTISGGFRYSTTVSGGSDRNALDAFLRDRVGYCEQFAATMALMARTLGIPARVVVGFTSGRQEGDQWVVRGTDAHAWPELWMGTAGWVRFEPTPGAATVRTPAYTRAVGSGLPPGLPTPAASAGAGGAGANGRRPDIADDVVSATGVSSGIPWRVVGALALLVVLLLVPAAVRQARRRRRLRGAPELAYRELVDAARDYGALAAEQATVRATIGSIGAALGVADDVLQTAVRAAAAGPWGDPRAAIAATRRGTLPGLDGDYEADAHQAELAVALARICGTVERERYARQDEPGLVVAVAGSRPPGDSSGSSQLARDGVSDEAGPGGLGADVRIVCGALRAAAPRWRRIIAPVAPASLLPARAGSAF